MSCGPFSWNSCRAGWPRSSPDSPTQRVRLVGWSEPACTPSCEGGLPAGCSNCCAAGASPLPSLDLAVGQHPSCVRQHALDALPYYFGARCSYPGARRGVEWLACWCGGTRVGPLFMGHLSMTFSHGTFVQIPDAGLRCVLLVSRTSTPRLVGSIHTCPEPSREELLSASTCVLPPRYAGSAGKS